MTARVSIFLGKGGVGKTTLAAAFAADRAAHGERVLLLSIQPAAELEARIREGVETAALGGNLDLLNVDPRELVDDLVRAVLKMGAMTDVVLRSPAYASLLDIVPGVREMAMLNLVWHHAHGGRYKRIVLDGPATGHGLHLLEAPEKTAALLVGKLGERAKAIDRMVRDPKATEVVLVTLPEETPVRETVELARALRRGGFPLDNVVVNRWLPQVFVDPGSARVLDAFRRDAAARRKLERAIAQRTRIDVEAWMQALEVVRGQGVEASAHLAKLEEIDAKIGLVPHIPLREGRLLAIARAMGVPP